jgi:hypothetical protein
MPLQIMYDSEVERPPHAVFYYYWGAFKHQDRDTYDEAWYRAMRTQGSLLVRR